MPSFNPLAHYGSPVVPPPSTGSYGKADSYYPGGAWPAGTPLGATSVGDAKILVDGRLPVSGVIGSGVASDVNWQPTGQRVVANLTTPQPQTAPSSSTDSTNGTPSTTGRLQNEIATVRLETTLDDVAAKTTLSTEPPIRIIEPRTPPTASSTVQFDRMAVNDATTPAEPQRLDPPTEAINISRSTQTASTPIRSASLPSDGEWRSRYVPDDRLRR
jgi:hypothetical protein